MNLTINVSTHQLSASPVKKSGFEDRISSNNANIQYRHRHRHHNIHEKDEEEEEDDDDDIVDEDGSSSMSSSPSIPDENINFDLVYALHTFTATVEGQASVVKGEALVLMEDTNIYWWLVEVLKTREIGYIPAENIETPYERLARLNKHRNVEITSSIPVTTLTTTTNSIYSTKKVTIADEDALTTINFFEVDSELDSEEDNEEDDGDYFDIIDSEDEACQTTEKDLIMAGHQLSPLSSPQSLTHSIEADPSSSSPYKQQQSVTIQQRQQKQRPRHYLTPSVLKRDTSSLSLSSDGSYKRHSLETHDLRVFAGNIGQGPLFHTFNIKSVATTEDLLKEVIKRFDIVDGSPDDQNNTNKYYVAVQGTDGDDYILGPQDKPVSIFKTLTASLTTPMPIVSQNICRKPREDATRRKRSSSFGDHGQTNYEEDSVIRFYIHRRVKRTQERHGLVYIKISLYPDEYSNNELSVPYQQQFLPVSTVSTPHFLFKSKKTLSTDSLKTEIDRIDKVLPVSYDSLVGSVINTALEKLHIPDAEADGLPLKKLSTSFNSSTALHQTRKYSMFTRNECGQEKLLNATITMANVLHDQQHQQVSDMLFIIRQSDSALQKSKQPYNKQQNTHPIIRHNSCLGNEGSEASGDRQPSILNIVTNYSPEFTIGRHSSFKSNSTSQGSIKDEQPSNFTLSKQQNRSKSLSSPAASNRGIQSPTTGFFRPRQMINPASPTQSDTGPLTSVVTISKRHGCISKSANTDSKKRKERTSFKQQLKRLISWGSFSSLRQKNARDLTEATTSPDSPSTSSKKPQQLTFIVSDMSFSKAAPETTVQQPKIYIQSDSGTSSSSNCAIPSPGSTAASSPLSQWQHVDLERIDDSPRQHHNENKVREHIGPSLSPKASSESHISRVDTMTSLSSSSHNSTGASDRDVDDNDNDDGLISSSSSFDDCDKANPHKATCSNTPELSNLLPSSHLLSSQGSTLGQGSRRRDDFDDDVFFLVTQGVDYLKAKECTKWDDEEKGGLLPPVSLVNNDSLPLDTTLIDNENEDNAPAHDTACLDSARDIIQTDDPITMETSDQQESLIIKQSPVNDEELHWIVNSHILF